LDYKSGGQERTCLFFCILGKKGGIMATYQRSKIKFESKTVQSESGRCIGMFEIDCIPPPAGAERTFVYEKEAAPMIQQHFMQAEELAGLLAGAAKPGEIVDSAILLEDLAAQFGFTNLVIDEKNLPLIWKNGSLCFTVTVSYMVLYMVWEIKATAAEQFTDGTTTWPKDDTVATFRIMVPHSYTFRRDYQWNPGCCMSDRRIKEPDIHGPFPAYYLDIRLPRFWKSKPGWDLWPRIEFKDKDDK
jgi:hypothetical protein